MFYNKEIGDLGEKAAAKFLKKNGYKILEKNFESEFGEIDIIARNKDELVFVEVKTRSTKAFGGGSAAVNYHKRRNIILTSEVYMKKKKYSKRRRYDIIEVYINKDRDITEINHIRNGFPWEGQKRGFW